MWSFSEGSVDHSDMPGGDRAPQATEDCLRHKRYNIRRDTPNSSDSATMFSQCFIRSTAIWRNAAGCLPFRFSATRSSFPCKVCQLRVSHFTGSVQAAAEHVLTPPYQADRRLGLGKKMSGGVIE